MARVHCRKHVDDLGPANLAHDESIGPKPQRGAQQHRQWHRTTALDVWGLGLERDNVWVVESQFCGVFDRHDSLAMRNLVAQRVGERRLAGACGTGDDDVAASLDKFACHVGEDVAAKRRDVDSGKRESSNRDARPTDRDGSDDGTETRSVGESSIHDR